MTPPPRTSPPNSTRPAPRLRPRPLELDVELLKAMGDETRSQILSVLCTPREGTMVPWTVTDIAQTLGLSASTASHHLQRLLRADLVRVERRGKERLYTLALDRLLRQVGQFHQQLSLLRRATDLGEGGR
jgi:DNA-binding transcriptional ArsR family regulator